MEAHPHRNRVKAENPAAVSVRTLPNGRTTYAHSILIRDARFVVQPAGRERAVRDGARNVHAWVRGHAESFSLNPHPEGPCAPFDEAPTLSNPGNWVQVAYNPFAGPAFRRRDTHPSTGQHHSGPQVLGARLVLMIGAQCWALDPAYA